MLKGECSYEKKTKYPWREKIFSVLITLTLMVSTSSVTAFAAEPINTPEVQFNSNNSVTFSNLQ